jgi:murein DD-endopeptidase MepM/ murein hydrolase activator NlpD
MDPDSTPVKENWECTQIEIVATCDYRKRGLAGWTHVDDLPDSLWKWLGGFLRWIAPLNGMPLTSTVQWRAYQRYVQGRWVDDPNGAYGLNASQRLTSAQYDAYRGVLGHQHASGNDHADPGPIGAGVERAIAYAKGIPTEVPVSEVHVSNDPPSADTGYTPVEHLFVKADGTLWAEVADSVIIEPPPVVIPPPVVEPPPVQPPPASGGDYPPPTSKTVYLNKLHYGQADSDSVWYLQDVLNRHSLAGGSTLPLTGGYFDQTDHEVILCQQQHGFGNDAPGTSYVGPSQADHLFAGSGLTVVKDGSSGGGGTPPPTQPPPTGTIDTPFPGAVITTPYGVKGSWAAGFHTGQDYACPVGTPLRATWTGKVVAINAWGAAYGLHVIYEQTINGVVCRTAYCHMSRIDIALNASTVPGTHLGLSGNTGNTTGPHLHLEQRTYPFAYNNKVQKPVM